MSLDTKFWRHFATKYWEQKPLLLQNVKTNLLELGEADIFKLLVRYANHCRKTKDPAGFKFYIDGIRTYPDEVLQFLPQQNDKSLLGYHARMNEQFNDYCLVCDELLQVNAEKQNLLTGFTSELYRHVGFPNRFAEMGLYLGNYRKTPFGVHVDNCGVFSIPVVGTKRFRLWPPSYLKKHPELERAFKYSRHKKQSILLVAKPGDLTYWPSSAWHIAESDGSFSATWSLGVWVDQPHQEMLLNGLQNIFKQILGSDAQHPTTPFTQLHEPNGQVNQLPPLYLHSLKKLREISMIELQDSFLTEWMMHISKQGFKHIPNVDYLVNLDSKLKLQNPQALILWQQSLIQKNIVSICFAGTLIKTSKKSKLLDLIRALNSGSTCAVRDYLNGSGQKQNLKHLQVLASAGAFGQS